MKSNEQGRGSAAIRSLLDRFAKNRYINYLLYFYFTLQPGQQIQYVTDHWRALSSVASATNKCADYIRLTPDGTSTYLFHPNPCKCSTAALRLKLAVSMAGYSGSARHPGFTKLKLTTILLRLAQHKTWSNSAAIINITVLWNSVRENVVSHSKKT